MPRAWVLAYGAKPEAELNQKWDFWFEPRVSEHSAEHEVKMLMTFEAFGCHVLSSEEWVRGTCVLKLPMADKHTQHRPGPARCS